MINLIKKILKEEFQNEKLWEVRMDMFHGENDYERYLNMMEIYEQLKDKKGFTGIKVYGSLDLDFTPIKSLTNIVSVSGFISLGNTLIEDLGVLEYVGSLFLSETRNIKSLSNLKEVRYDLSLKDSLVNSLGNLKKVGGNIIFDSIFGSGQEVQSKSPIKSLNKLEYVGGDLKLYNSSIEDLGELKEVGGDLTLYGAPLKSLGNLKKVGGTLNIAYTLINSLGNLRFVGRDLKVYETQLQTTEEKVRNKIDVVGRIYWW